MPGHEPHCLTTVGSLQDDRFRPQLTEHAAQRVANEHVIVDHKNWHSTDPAASPEWRAYFSPGPKYHLGETGVGDNPLRAKSYRSARGMPGTSVACARLIP